MKNRNIAFLMLVMFLFGGIVHVIAKKYNQLMCSEALVYSLASCIWGLSVSRRITDLRIRKFFIGISACVVLWMVMRVCKFIVFTDYICIIRLLWYGFYIPFTIMPLLGFYISLSMFNKKSLKKWNLLIIPLIILNILILTNDYHQLAFYFTDGYDNLNEYVRGPVYYLSVIWSVAMFIAMLVTTVNKSKLPNCQKKIWMPVLPLIVGTFYILLLTFEVDPVISYSSVSVQIFLYEEVTCFMIIGVAEGFIHAGLIQTNTGYDKIFTMSSLSAQIADYDGNIVMCSSDTDIIPEDVRISIMNGRTIIRDKKRFEWHHIHGGDLFFTVDISTIQSINKKLEETAEILECENEIIEAENKIKEERIHYQTKNKIFDDIAQIVKPQILKIEKLISDENNSEFDDNLAFASFLNVYIKRISNLTIISHDSKNICLEELYLSVSESLKYLELCNVMTSINGNNLSEIFSVDRCIDAYNFFESFIEFAYGNFSSIIITLKFIDNILYLRIYADCTNFSDQYNNMKNVNIYKDEESVTITAEF